MPVQNIYPKTDKKEAFSLVIYEKHGRHFELDVDPDYAIAFREGKLTDMKDVIKAWHIYSDVKRAFLASEGDLNAVFNTSNVEEIAKFMLKNGQIQLSHNYRKLKTEKLYNRIVSGIHRMAIDARTELPLPLQRIQNGLEEIKFRVKEGESFDRQLKNAISKLKLVIPLRIANTQYSLYFDFKFTDAILRYIKTVGTIQKKNTYQNQMYIVAEIPSGLKNEFIDQLNTLTHGNVKIDHMK